MKYSIFFLSIFSLLWMSGCNKDKIFLEIKSPVNGKEYKIYEDIDVNITAYTQKGTITQLVLIIDTLETVYFTEKPPYFHRIEKYTFKDTGLYFISATAYSTEGVREGAAIDIKIKK